MSDKQGKKKISVSFDSPEHPSRPYEYFLVQSTEDALRIDLAEMHEGTSEIKIVVKESIAISSDAMLRFALDLFSELINYEEKFHNGKGLPAPVDPSSSEV